jgi:hypothetical protein
MTIDPDAQLQQALEMTRQMLELLKAGEWEAVAALGSERLQLLKQWGRDKDPAKAQRYIGALREIQALDQEIETLGRQGRNQATSQLQQIHRGRKAGKAYRN